MKKEDILAKCIDEILAGKCSLEDCLATYPELSDELRPLLEVATGIQPIRTTPSPEFKQRARNQLLKAMEPSAAPKKHAGTGISGWFKPLVPAKGMSFPLIASLIIFALIAAGSTTAYASQRSLPDDTLYPVKTGVENLQLALTRSPEAKASLHLKLAQRRIEEVIAQSSLGRNMSASALEAAATQINAAIKEIDSILPENARTLLSQLSELTLDQQLTLSQVLEAAPESTQPAVKQAIEATRRGNLIAQVAYGNPAFLSSSPSVLDDKLEAAYFELEGTLLSIEGSTWNIGGLIIKNVNSPHRLPLVGSRVEIKGMVQGSRIFISEIEPKKTIGGKVKITGVFGGTGSDGTVWYVGGIPIGRPQSISLPPQGTRLKFEGIVQNGILTLTQMGSEESEEGKIEIEGVLVQVDSSQKTIAVEAAGTQTTVNISEALIMGEDGQPLTLSDLELLVGEDIKVEGLHLKDSLLYAKKVRVAIEQEEKAQKDNNNKVHEADKETKDGGDIAEED